MVDAVGTTTLQAIATAGPDTQVCPVSVILLSYCALGTRQFMRCWSPSLLVKFVKHNQNYYLKLDVFTSIRGLHQKNLVLSSSGSWHDGKTPCQESGRMRGSVSCHYHDPSLSVCLSVCSFVCCLSCNKGCSICFMAVKHFLPSCKSKIYDCGRGLLTRGICKCAKLIYHGITEVHFLQIREYHSKPTSFYGQPLDITWPYHVTSSALSVVGPSLSLVRRSGTRYWTVSATRHSPATASEFRQSLKTNLFRRYHSAHTAQ